ncbi:MAG: hypothetical protein M1836_002044 [Candelina mexicana]|nr:MAG: hypothetical protein M1836_002044 [Candelina mexicana]
MASSTSALTAPADNVEYVIYPWDGTNSVQTSRILEILQSCVKSNSIYTSESRYLGVNFWRAKMSAKDVAMLQSHKEIASINPSRTGDDTYDPHT